MNNLFSSLFDCVRKKTALFILLCITTIAIIVLAVFSAISFNGGVLPIDLSNIAYMKFLMGDSGFAMLIFGNLLSLGLIYGLIILFSCKKYLIPLALIFYLYFVYSQTVVFISILLIYGFFNVLLLLILLLIYLLAEFIIFLLMLTILCTLSNANDYFKCCFKNKSFLLCTLMLLLVMLIFSLLLAILKSFIILLIF